MKAIITRIGEEEVEIVRIKGLDDLMELVDEYEEISIRRTGAYDSISVLIIE